MEDMQDREEQPYQPTPSEQMSSEGKKASLKTFALLKVGMIEIFFFGIVIVLFFGILNYFNILPLSKTFPNQLGWLPHRPQSNNLTLTMKQFNNVGVTIVPTIPPSVSLLEPARQTLLEFLPTILNPSLLPSSSGISLTQNKGLVESISASWNTQEGTLSAVLVVSPNSKNIVQLYLPLMQTQNVPPSVKLASTITSNLFSIKPKGVWGCKPLNNSMTYCENFWEEGNGIRRGLGMKGLFTQGVDLISGKPEAMLVFCEHTKESKIYSWKSCEYEFAKSGVQ